MKTKNKQSSLFAPRFHHQRMPSHFSAVQRSLQNDSATAQLSRLTNGTMFNKLHGLNGSALRTSNSTPVNNSLLRFSVEALASSAADSAQQRNEDANGSLPNLGENSKLDLSNFGLMNMAARLGYGSYFGATGTSAFENFAQLSNLNSQLNAAGADARSLFNANNDLLSNQNGSEVHQSDDEDVTSITSWDEEMINQDTEDEEDEMLMNQEKLKSAKGNKKRNEHKSDYSEDNPDDEDNIDIMDDIEK